MSVDMTKRANNAQISLIKILEEKRDAGVPLGEVVAQLIVACDYSYSMKKRYEEILRGYTKPEVPDIAERVLGVAMSGLDDDNKVPWFMFDDQVYEPFIVTPETVDNCIENWAMIPDPRPAQAQRRGFLGRKTATSEPAMVRREYGGTDYLVVIDAILEYIKENGLDAPGQPPILIAFITDGAPPRAQEQAIMDRLIAARKISAFWQVVGLGYTPEFLKKLNKMKGGIDNVGLFSVSDIITLSDEEFYDQFLSEFFREWLPEARKIGLTNK